MTPEEWQAEQDAASARLAGVRYILKAELPDGRSCSMGFVARGDGQDTKLLTALGEAMRQAVAYEHVDEVASWSAKKTAGVN